MRAYKFGYIPGSICKSGLFEVPGVGAEIGNLVRGDPTKVVPPPVVSEVGADGTICGLQAL